MNKRAKVAGWIAAALSLIWFAVHTFVGGPEVADPLLASDLPIAVTAPAWMVWNMVTVTLVLIAAFFGLGTWKGNRSLIGAATFLSLGLALAGIVSAPLSGAGFAVLPQGFLFVVSGLAGAIAWSAMR